MEQTGKQRLTDFILGFLYCLVLLGLWLFARPQLMAVSSSSALVGILLIFLIAVPAYLWRQRHRPYFVYGMLTSPLVLVAFLGLLLVELTTRPPDE